MSPPDKNAPFFMQDMEQDGQQQRGENSKAEYDDASTSNVENSSPISAELVESSSSSFTDNKGNGDSGGMDAYARQMQELTRENGGGTTPMSSESESQSNRIETPRPPSPPPPPPVQDTSAASYATAEETSTASTNEDNNNQPISSVDARVLESILQEGKLNLSSEAEVKKLLEGPRLQEGEKPGDADMEDGKYNSKFVSAVSDNSFWNSLRAKADEIIESVGIYIENRIERDSQTLAAVGLFTLERIRRDVGRALPAAGRATRKLLLSTNSTYAEKLLDVTDKTPFALPSERSLTDREMYEDGANGGGLYEELSTPADEIRQVTEAIRDILLGKELPDSDPNSRRGVRSFAPAGTSRLAERQRLAYKARKKTVLKREEEGIDRKLGRALGSVTDATWEFRREMQTDAGREAGYRSKGVRNALAAGAVKLLEAGREGSKKLLSGDIRRNLIGGDTTAGFTGPGVVGDQPEILDVSPWEEEEIIQDVIEEANMEYAPDGLLSPQSFIEEKRRLIASLESCLSQPSETWLTKEVVAQATEMGISLDGTVLREVITTMVTLRDELQNEMQYIDEQQQFDYLKMEYVQSELRRMKQLVDSVSSVAISAAGEAAAFLLKQELEGFVLSDSLDDIIEIELERMEQLLAERVAAREEERMQLQRKRQQQQQRQTQQQQYRNEVVVEPVRFVDTDVVGVEAVESTTTAAKEAQWNGGIFTEVEVVSSSEFGQEGLEQQNYQTSPSSSNVEVVSNTEYTEYEQQFKSAQGVIDTTGEGEYDMDDMNENKENPAADFILRSVDVIFFIGEKFFLVLLPDLITGGKKVTSRYAQALNRGRGSVGWKPLKNAKTKNIR